MRHHDGSELDRYDVCVMCKWMGVEWEETGTERVIGIMRFRMRGNG
jgi:hypothetical protein